MLRNRTFFEFHTAEKTKAGKCAKTGESGAAVLNSRKMHTLGFRSTAFALAGLTALSAAGIFFGRAGSASAAASLPYIETIRTRLSAAEDGDKTFKILEIVPEKDDVTAFKSGSSGSASAGASQTESVYKDPSRYNFTGSIGYLVEGQEPVDFDEALSRITTSSSAAGNAAAGSAAGGETAGNGTSGNTAGNGKTGKDARTAWANRYLGSLVSLGLMAPKAEAADYPLNPVWSSSNHTSWYEEKYPWELSDSDGDMAELIFAQQPETVYAGVTAQTADAAEAEFTASVSSFAVGNVSNRGQNGFEQQISTFVPVSSLDNGADTSALVFYKPSFSEKYIDITTADPAVYANQIVVRRPAGSTDSPDSFWELYTLNGGWENGYEYTTIGAFASSDNDIKIGSTVTADELSGMKTDGGWYAAGGPIVKASEGGEGLTRLFNADDQKQPESFTWVGKDNGGNYNLKFNGDGKVYTSSGKGHTTAVTTDRTYYRGGVISNNWFLRYVLDYDQNDFSGDAASTVNGLSALAAKIEIDTVPASELRLTEDEKETLAVLSGKNAEENATNDAGSAAETSSDAATGTETGAGTGTYFDPETALTDDTKNQKVALSEYDMIFISGGLGINATGLSDDAELDVSFGDPAGYSRKGNDLSPDVRNYMERVYSSTKNGGMKKPVVFDGSVLMEAGSAEDREDLNKKDEVAAKALQTLGAKNNVAGLALDLIRTSHDTDNATGEVPDSTDGASAAGNDADASTDGIYNDAIAAFHLTPQVGYENGFLRKNIFGFRADGLVADDQKKVPYNNKGARAALAGGAFHSDYDRNKTEYYKTVGSAFYRVYAEIVQENALRKRDGGDGAAQLPAAVSEASVLRYVLNYAGQRPDNTKDAIRILDIEPDNHSDLTEPQKNASGNVTDQHPADGKPSKTVLSWLGDAYSAKEVTIETVSTAELVGKIEDIAENYDMIYIGTDTTDCQRDFNDKNMERLIYYNIGDTVRASTALRGMKTDDYYQYWPTGAKKADDLSNQYRFLGNDLTEKKKNEILTFAELGFPVILSDQLVNDAQTDISTNTVDSASMIYEMLKKLWARHDANVFTAEEALKNTGTIFNAANLSKPEIEFVDTSSSEGNQGRPADYTEGKGTSAALRELTDAEAAAYETGSAVVGGSAAGTERSGDSSASAGAAGGSGTSTGSTGDSTEGKKHLLSFTFRIVNVTDPEPEKTQYTASLFLDTNGDGLFSSDEEAAGTVVTRDEGSYTKDDPSDVFTTASQQRIDATGLSGALSAADAPVYTLNLVVTQKLTGMIPWKLVVTQNNGMAYHDSENGYAYAPAANPKTIRILQLNSDSWVSTGSTQGTYGNNYTNTYDLEWQCTETGSATRYSVKDADGTMHYYNGIYGKYIHDPAVAADFDIRITTILPDYIKYGENQHPAFNGKWHNNDASWFDNFLKDYDMIIVGFHDCYGELDSAAARAIESFADSGKAVLFTHDTTSFVNFPTEDAFKAAHASGTKDTFWGYNFNALLRSRLYLDKYGISDRREYAVPNEWGGTSPTVFGGAGVQNSGLYPEKLDNNSGSWVEDNNNWDAGLLAQNRQLDAQQQAFLLSADDTQGKIPYSIAYTPGSGYWDSTSQTVTGKAFDKYNEGYTDYCLSRYASRNANMKMNYQRGGSDALYTSRVSQTNKGQITTYPFNVNTAAFDTASSADGKGNSAEDGSAGTRDTLAVSKTHFQYYALNLNADNIVVWYCLAPQDATTGTNFAKLPNDVTNAYYIFSAGNVTYTGAGHADPSLVTEDEAKLFVNTMVAAFRAGKEAPTGGFYSSANGKTPVSRLVLANRDLAADPGTSAAPANGGLYQTSEDPSVTTLPGSSRIYFMVTDPNFQAERKTNVYITLPTVNNWSGPLKYINTGGATPPAGDGQSGQTSYTTGSAPLTDVTFYRADNGKALAQGESFVSGIMYYFDLPAETVSYLNANGEAEITLLPYTTFGAGQESLFAKQEYKLTIQSADLLPIG